jgi:hypothetical protein
MVVAWHGRGMACVKKHGRTVEIKWERHNLNLFGTAWQGKGMGAAWERHCMCELALKNTLRSLTHSMF